MYSRASLSRTVTRAVALSLTAVSTGVDARAFGAADTRIVIDLNRSNGATIGSEILVNLEPWRSIPEPAPFPVASGSKPRQWEIHAHAQPDAAPARLIERIRAVE